jgi:hypothetical protein
MFLSKSSIDQILGIDSCVVSIFNDIVERVSDDERLTKKLWEDYFYDVDDLLNYTEDSRDVHRYSEFDDYLMELVRDTPVLDCVYVGNRLDLDEMSGVISVINGDSNLLSLIDKFKSGKMIHQDSIVLHNQIIEEYLNVIDSHDFTSSEEHQLWELLETEGRTDEFLLDRLCIQDKVVEDEFAIRNYVDEKMSEEMTIDEMREVVQLCMNTIDNDGNEDEDVGEEDIYGYEEDEE